MPRRSPLLDASNNTSTSSYETALSTSFADRSNEPKKEEPTKRIKEEPMSDEEDYENRYCDDVLDLENEVSMLSIASPAVTNTKNVRQSIFSPITTSKTSSTCEAARKTSLLSVIEDEAERRLLAELYPELLEEENDLKLKKSFEKVTKEEPLEELREYREQRIIKEEPESPVSSTNRSETPSSEVGGKISPTTRSPAESSSGDETFEKYLQFLQTPSSKFKKEQPKRREIEKFVVDDDYISETSDVDESEESASEQSSDDEVAQSLSRKDKFKTYEKERKHFKDDDAYFLESLSKNYKYKRHDEALVFVKNEKLRGEKMKKELTEKLAEIFLRRCFPELSPTLLKFDWNNRLYKTAGQCKNHRNMTSTIELSRTVCTTAERVRDTLVHELCHAATWVVDKLYKEGHGPGWKKWASRCMRTFRCLPMIERCHDYQIDYKCLYICVGCGQKVKRQSKSLDIEKKVCGLCGGRFELQKSGRSAESNKFALFVKQHYAVYKTNGLKHAEVMAVLSKEYKKSISIVAE